jgi:hypothetical protein
VIDVSIERGSRRVFAAALDWPGWCRAGKDEGNALAALAAYAPRYAPVAEKARIAFDPKPAAAFRVVEHLAGTATTDFGAPDSVAKRDTRPLAALEVRKGPRGGGRDRDQIADHVLGAEGAYVRKLGLRLKPPARGDRRGIAGFHAAIADVVGKASTGKPLVERGWPQRYAARRIAWHALDHAWEIQDRSTPSGG